MTTNSIVAEMRGVIVAAGVVTLVGSGGGVRLFGGRSAVFGAVGVEVLLAVLFGFVGSVWIETDYVSEWPTCRV